MEVRALLIMQGHATAATVLSFPALLQVCAQETARNQMSEAPLVLGGAPYTNQGRTGRKRNCGKSYDKQMSLVPQTGSFPPINHTASDTLLPLPRPALALTLLLVPRCSAPAAARRWTRRFLGLAPPSGKPPSRLTHARRMMTMTAWMQSKAPMIINT